MGCFYLEKLISFICRNYDRDSLRVDIKYNLSSLVSENMLRGYDYSERSNLLYDYYCAMLNIVFEKSFPLSVRAERLSYYKPEASELIGNYDFKKSFYVFLDKKRSEVPLDLSDCKTVKGVIRKLIDLGFSEKKPASEDFSGYYVLMKLPSLANQCCPYYEIPVNCVSPSMDEESVVGIMRRRYGSYQNDMKRYKNNMLGK